MKMKFFYLSCLILFVLFLIGCESLTEHNSYYSNLNSERLDSEKQNKNENGYYVDLIETTDDAFVLNKNDGIFIITSEDSSSAEFGYEMKTIEESLKTQLKKYGFKNIVFSSQIRDFNMEENPAIYAIANDCRYMIGLGFDSIKTFNYGGGLSDSLAYIVIADCASGLVDISLQYLEGGEESQPNGKNNLMTIIVASTAENNLQRYYPSWKTFSSIFAEELAKKLAEKCDENNDLVGTLYSQIKNELQQNAKAYLTELPNNM